SAVNVSGSARGFAADATEPPADAPALSGGLRIWRLLSFRQTWAFIVVSAVGQPVGWFFLYWLPKFFSSQFGLSIAKIGAPLVVVYTMALTGSICGGALPAAMLRRRWSVNLSRKSSLLLCAVLMV